MCLKVSPIALYYATSYLKKRSPPPLKKHQHWKNIRLTGKKQDVNEECNLLHNNANASKIQGWSNQYALGGT